MFIASARACCLSCWAPGVRDEFFFLSWHYVFIFTICSRLTALLLRHLFLLPFNFRLSSSSLRNKWSMPPVTLCSTWANLINVVCYQWTSHTIAWLCLTHGD